MSNSRIPLDVMYAILSELPVKPFVRFKSMSKECCSLINDPYFIKLHFKQSMETNKNNNLSIILKECQSGKLFSLGFDISANFESLRELNHPLKQPSDHGVHVYDHTQVLGSCNGLLCIGKEVRTYKH
ncbi:hypothetical protein PTKIN_Ptkin08bG0036300 [Pterospermum kingtungense]